MELTTNTPPAVEWEGAEQGYLQLIDQTLLPQVAMNRLQGYQHGLGSHQNVESAQSTLPSESRRPIT